MLLLQKKETNIYNETIEVFDKLTHLAWTEYCITQLLNIYSQNTEQEEISAGLLEYMTENLKNIQMKIIDNIDTYTTEIDHKYLKSKNFHPDFNM